MKELLNKAFQAGIHFNFFTDRGENPQDFEAWYNSDEIQEQIKLSIMKKSNMKTAKDILNIHTANGCRELTEERVLAAMVEFAKEGHVEPFNLSVRGKPPVDQIHQEETVCPDCDGRKYFPDKESTSGQKPCSRCWGTGKIMP